MKRMRNLLTVLAFPLLLLACPDDEEGGDYDIPEEEGSIMGPNASAPAIQLHGPYAARIG